MAYGYQRPDPEVVFRNWVKYQRDLQLIAIEEGFSEEEAMKLLEIWQLAGIQDNTGNIGSY